MYSDALQAAIDGVEGIADTFNDPDDDFAPVAFIVRDGVDDPSIALFPMDKYMENKDMLFEVMIPTVIRKFRANSVVTVMSCFGVSTDAPLDGVQPKDHPDRWEAVLVTELTADGIKESLVSYISRDPLGKARPTITPFETFYTEASEVGGRTIDPLIAALKDVREEQ